MDSKPTQNPKSSKSIMPDSPETGGDFSPNDFALALANFLPDPGWSQQISDDCKVKPNFYDLIFSVSIIIHFFGEIVFRNISKL